MVVTFPTYRVLVHVRKKLIQLKDFLGNFLEPISYLFYAIALYGANRLKNGTARKVLYLYYVIATILMSIACAIAFHNLTDRRLRPLLLKIKRLLPFIDIEQNPWLYNFFFVSTIIVLSYYFYKLLVSPIKRKIIVSLVVINLIPFIIVIIPNGFYNAHTHLYAFVFISIVAYCLLYFHHILTNIDEETVFYKFDFWFVISYLLYFLGGFFSMVTYSYIETTNKVSIYAILNVLLFISAAISIFGIGYIYVKSKTYV
jgi:hypothetical protein